MDNSQKNIGYSVVDERPYVLGPDVKLPIFSFLTDELHVRYKDILREYVCFCKKKLYNPCASTTYYFFTQFVRSVKSPREQKRYLNFLVLLSRAMKSTSEQCAKPEPQVVFRPIESDGTIRPSPPTETRESIVARSQQGTLKELLLDKVVEDPRPVLDVGGGKNSTIKALSKRGVNDRSVVVVDPLQRVGDYLTVAHLSKYPNHQVLANHSLYHVPVPVMIEVVNRNPRGITMVLDGKEDLIEVNEEDYEFKAVRMREYPTIEAYRVTGNIFMKRSRSKKGRLFRDEIWYTRRQWSKWGFNLYADPAEPSPFVKKHVVLFDRLFSPTPSILARHPYECRLGLGALQTTISTKPPPMYELFTSETSRNSELACYYGMPVYQTPKLDGLHMRLICHQSKEVHLVDRMGLQYRVGTAATNLFFSRVISFELAVEVMPTAGCSSYKLYANQLIKSDFTINATDSLDQLIKHVELINDLVSYDLVGLKEYKLTRNSIASINSELCYDGVVYMPAYVLSNSSRPQIHSFVKPFAGTETVMRVLTISSNRSKTTRAEFEIYYRAQALAADKSSYTVPIQRNTVFKQSIVKLMSGCSNDTTDLFGPTTISPLLYEGYYIPAGLLGTEKDVFVITHLRGDKARKDCDVKVTKNRDWLERGVIGLTRWGKDGQEVVLNFFMNLSSMRVMKLLPSNVGVQATFLTKFMARWADNLESKEYEPLNKNVIAGHWIGSVEDLIKALRQKLTYNVALMVLDTLMAYPFVLRDVEINGEKIRTKIKFRPTDEFKSMILEDFTDPLEAARY